jgi:hypothetical protein
LESSWLSLFSLLSSGSGLGLFISCIDDCNFLVCHLPLWSCLLWFSLPSLERSSQSLILIISLSCFIKIINQRKKSHWFHIPSTVSQTFPQIFFDSTGVWTLGLVFAKQAVYHLSHTLSLKLLLIVRNNGSELGSYRSEVTLKICVLSDKVILILYSTSSIDLIQKLI